MKTSKRISSRNPDPKDPKKPNENPDKDKQPNPERPNNPGKPDNDPDQTPERETNKPPVAEPEKGNKEQKFGFADYSSL
jgi:hypothetical protein